MSYPRPIPKIMGDVVQAVSTAILSDIQAAELAILQITHPEATESNIVAINYLYGHFSEIIETMKQYEYSPQLRYEKYPLIALILDIPEQYGSSGGYPGECTLHMAICYGTGTTLKAEERYTQVIKHILLPIYEELMKQIGACAEFVTMGKSDHTMEEHPYWGKGGLGDTAGNVFADAVDAIEITNLRLIINFYPNC